MAGKQYVLPNWKKIHFSSDRGLTDQNIEGQLSVLALELSCPEARDLVIKLRAANDYDANLKILNSADVKVVKVVLKELGGKSEGLVKEGICFAIMREILRRLPHKCVDCNLMVTYDPMAPGCKIILCTKCYPGKYNNVVCGPCGAWIVERYALPKELHTKHHQKKMDEVPRQSLVEKDEETFGDSDNSLGESMQCGQPRAESTILTQVPHRGGSLLCDTILGDQTIVEKTIIVNTAGTGPAHSSPKVKQQSETPQGPQKEYCKFFLKGCCKFGFNGRNKTDESGENHLDKYTHPVLCRKYMDHGNTSSGCTKGKDCDKAHVTLCLESLEYKVCSCSTEGKRCQYGYHL